MAEGKLWRLVALTSRYIHRPFILEALSLAGPGNNLSMQEQGIKKLKEYLETLNKPIIIMIIFTVIVFLLGDIMAGGFLTIVYWLLMINIFTYSGWVVVARGFGLLSAALAGFIVSTLHFSIELMFYLFSMNENFDFLREYSAANLFVSFVILNIVISSIAMLMAVFGGIFRRRRQRISVAREST